MEKPFVQVMRELEGARLKLLEEQALKHLIDGYGRICMNVHDEVLFVPLDTPMKPVAYEKSDMCEAFIYSVSAGKQAYELALRPAPAQSRHAAGCGSTGRRVMAFKEGQRVVLHDSTGEIKDDERGVILEIEEGDEENGVYGVEVDKKIDPHDDRIREVGEDQMYDEAQFDSYVVWCEQVVAICIAAERVRGYGSAEKPHVFLERCRGDEPWDVFAGNEDECGGEHKPETPESYAAFIMEMDEAEGNNGYLSPED